MQQLDLLAIPKQPGKPPGAITVVTSKQIRAYVRHSLQDLPARQAERDRRRAAKRQPKTQRVTMPTLFDMEPTEEPKCTDTEQS